MPPSTARRTIGSASFSSSAHLRDALSPKLIMPRQIRETLRPVEPSRAYSIASSLARPTDERDPNGATLPVGGRAPSHDPEELTVLSMGPSTLHDHGRSCRENVADRDSLFQCAVERDRCRPGCGVHLDRANSGKDRATRRALDGYVLADRQR